MSRVVVEVEMLTFLKAVCLSLLCLSSASAAFAREEYVNDQEKYLIRSLILCQSWNERCTFQDDRIFWTKGPLFYRRLFLESGDTFGLFVLCGPSPHLSCHEALLCVSRAIKEREDVTGILIDVSDTDMREPTLWNIPTNAIQLRRDYVLGMYKHAVPIGIAFSLKRGILKDDWCSV